MNINAAHASSHRLALQDGATQRPPLVVFAAARWDFDWQRPQQFLTRLAKHYRVLYVEEPHTTHEDPWLECREVAPGVEVLVAHTRCDARGFHDAQLPVVGALLAAFMRERGIARPLVWLDTPAPLPLAEALDPRGLVYDCHDDAASTSDDDRLRHREARLMQLADVVVAGGPSLYQSHRARHANVQCVPNAVDPEHFAPTPLTGSSIESISARSLHAAIPGPRLGWFGAIDERIDFDLLDRVAAQRPDWQIVMAGPVAPAVAATLPRRPNIHWIGPQTYAILPHLQAHWDVAILPLSCDAARHHANPEQALAYLAGQKSVVGTPTHDVAALVGHIVRLAPDANGFVEACRAAMTERGPLRRQRRIDALIAVHSCTWDRAADRVRKLLVECAREETPAAVPDALLAAAAMQQPAGRSRYAMN